MAQRPQNLFRPHGLRRLPQTPRRTTPPALQNPQPQMGLRPQRLPRLVLLLHHLVI